MLGEVPAARGHCPHRSECTQKTTCSGDSEPYMMNRLVMLILFPHLRARANDHVTLLERINAISVSPLRAHSLLQRRICASLYVRAEDSECTSKFALSVKRFTSIKARGQSVSLSVARNRKSVSTLCPGIDGCRQSVMFLVSGMAATVMKKTRMTASASVYLLRNVSTFPTTVFSSAERALCPAHVYQRLVVLD